MSHPKLRNYTTTVHAERSIGEIQGLLVQFGADKIMLENEAHRTIGICFTFQVHDRPLPFKLPIDIRKAAQYLYDDYKANTTRGRKTRQDFEDEAYHICWRILRDWMHSQLSLLNIEMVKPEQVFLPYLYDGTRTLAESFSEGKLDKLLPKFEDA